ncbi:hypothetical protein F4802DRAFT_40470 [Xylaria palmicola]|nr:hypothetical protein F4802DRAFT_40470 [Xylaria palmicola]
MVLWMGSTPTRNGLAVTMPVLLAAPCHFILLAPQVPRYTRHDAVTAWNSRNESGHQCVDVKGRAHVLMAYNKHPDRSGAVYSVIHEHRICCTQVILRVILSPISLPSPCWGTGYAQPRPGMRPISF